MSAGKFSVEKARRLAEELIDSCVPEEDKWFMRIAMTLRAACNEIEFLKAEMAAREVVRLSENLGLYEDKDADA